MSEKSANNKRKASLPKEKLRSPKSLFGKGSGKISKFNQKDRLKMREL